MKKSEIEQKLKEILTYMNRYVAANGYPPTIREICRDMGLKSTATAYTYLKKMQARGMIVKSGSKNRAIGILQSDEENGEPKFAIAPLLGEVACGTPIFAEQNIEEYYPLPSRFKNGTDIFLLRARGESMLDAGILNGDKLICHKQETAEDGDIVVALLDDSAATVKRFYKKEDHVVLHPENTRFKDILVQDVQILGKVVGLYRSMI